MESKVSAKNLAISPKHAMEICTFIRSKNIQKARKQLELVLKKEVAVPAKRFKKTRAHRKGRLSSGFYPQKATKQILELLDSLEANAQGKGMNVNSLIITKAVANRASRPWHFGRQRGIKMKRAHVELVAEEEKQPKKEKK